MSLPLYPLPEQAANDEVDEEILEIFVEEVQEVEEEIAANIDRWKNNSTDKDALGNIRRAFHTLKGSGRLVGAMLIGELGWGIENMLNRLIEGSLPFSPTVVSLVGRARDLIPGLVADFQQGAGVNYDAHLLISQAHRFSETKGKELGEFTPDSASPSDKECLPTAAETSIPINEQVDDSEPVALDLLQELEISEMSDTALEIPTFDTQDQMQDPPAQLENEYMLSELTELAELEELPELPSSFAKETFTDQSDTQPDFPPNVDQSFEALSEAETEIAPPASSFQHTQAAEEVFLDPELQAIFQAEARTHLETLKQFLLACKKQWPCTLNNEIVRALHTLNGSSRNVHKNDIAALAAPMERYARGCMDANLPLRKEILALLAESGKLMHQILSGISIDLSQHSKVVGAWHRLISELPDEPSRTRRPKKAPPSMPLLDTVATQATLPQVSPPTPVLSLSSVAPPKIVYETPPEAVDEFMEIFLEEAEEILEKSQALVGNWLKSPNDANTIKELQRELHTLKGGARMVGISSMGDLSHQLESVLTKIADGNANTNPQLQAIVQESLDELATMLESVRAGKPLKVPTELIQRIANSLGVDSILHSHNDGAPKARITKPSIEPAVAIQPAPANAFQSPIQPVTQSVLPENRTPASQMTTPLQAEAKKTKPATVLDDENDERVRVRAVLIDKLTNLAGELSILRAHMEQQQGMVKSNLGEMDQTVMRLRDLLRRLEIETEAQIMSHYRQEPAAIDEDEEFDPLEMDRFSTMQQLSRSLMETVNDLQNIQETLKHLTRHSDSLLIQQNRIGAELQDGIMRTRMIPFRQISPRLQRIARLTAKELHKQVEFTINDDSIEFERTVLNRIVAPLEHMLRNAIGHGVEEPDVRQKKGKSAVANIQVELLKEGAELVIKLADDGAGLNLPAIRKKAEQKGLLKPEQKIDDADLAQFILEPAFSTAKTITQVSGRGVGMDIANSEIKQLGGTLKIHSKTGKGTTFEIRLPLSMTISQALLVHVGEETLAVPLHNVDAVMRVSRDDVSIESNEEEKFFDYMNRSYRISHLGEMLGFGRASVDIRLLPLLLVSSGDHRVALLVDGIEGSKEVVVKSVGPQLSGITWIAGATILGDGRVVIILDILTLMRANIFLQTTMVESHESSVLDKIKTIMVVDDSITVRKVTARLLQRQGMEVMTAKDGMDAVAQLQERVPDLMLLDVEMPRMDGFELATQIRNTAELKHLPIIMITSRTGSKHRERAAKIGIDRHLGKPFNETELLENINQLLTERSV